MNIQDVVKQCELEKIFVSSAYRISRNQMLAFNSANAAVATMQDAMGDMVIRVNNYILGMAKERITIHGRWPKDWWQAVRERWAPRWWLKRHPVQYKCVDVDKTIYEKVCPHLTTEDRSSHVRFFFKDDGIIPPSNAVVLSDDELKDLVDVLGLVIGYVGCEDTVRALINKFMIELRTRQRRPLV